MERCYQILKVNLKHNLLKYIFAILILFLLAPVLMSMKNLQEAQTAQILEVYVSLFGSIMLIPLFIPDEDLSIRCLLQSKKQSMLITHLIKLAEQVLILIAFVFLFMTILKLGDCSFDFGKLFFGVIGNCLFLGGIGILSYAIVNSLPFAYMVSIFYYVLCYGCGKDILKRLYLFYMSSGNYENNKYLFITGILMIFLGVIYRDLFSRLFSEK